VLIWEHSLVSPTDLSRIDKAFFDLNGYVSLLFLASVLAS
jgi:4-hydroxybenzoate polyprenyltransferase